MGGNSFDARDRMTVGDTGYDIFRLDRIPGADRLPYALKVLLENLLRNEDGRLVTAEQVRALAGWDPAAAHGSEIQFTPARVLLQDFTGVPCVVDLVAMRDAMTALGGDPTAINPLIPAELVIDHYRIEGLLFDGTLDPQEGLLRPDRSRPGLGLELKRADARRYQV